VSQQLLYVFSYLLAAEQHIGDYGEFYAIAAAFGGVTAFSKTIQRTDINRRRSEQQMCKDSADLLLLSCLRPAVGYSCKLGATMFCAMFKLNIGK
jgi:hypothetical protein